MCIRDRLPCRLACPAGAAGVAASGEWAPPLRARWPNGARPGRGTAAASWAQARAPPKSNAGTANPSPALRAGPRRRPNGGRAVHQGSIQ
eukprot:2831732-Alexandrium_andersonii.AAC.1